MILVKKKEIKMQKFIKFTLACFLSLGFSTMTLAGLDEIPKSITDSVYNPDLMDSMQPLGESAFREWKSDRSPPWTVGYASTYAGNTWRKGAMDRLLNDIKPKWQELGLLNDIVVTQSNLKDSLQIQQIRQLVDQGVDAIIICCSNPTALNQAIQYAFDRGVPVFSFTGYTTSPLSVSSSVNYHQAGYDVGTWMAEEIGGEGNVLVVEGIPGYSASDSQNRGVLDGLSQYPGIKVTGQIAHMWTSQVGQAETQKWLATHPGQLDGMAVQSSGETGVLAALQQSGREMVPLSIGGELGALCYWRNNPDYISAAIQTWPPGDDVELGWNIMMRTLQGQGPKIQSILVPPRKITYSDVETLLDEDCDTNSTGWYNPGIDIWGGADYLDNFFLRPADPEAYDPNS
jgi:ribose transport system substrate-binding protein